jgi:hypothetical protein
MLKFATYLPDHGWDTTVVTPKPSGELRWRDESQLGLLASGQVVRIGTLDQKRSFIERLARRVLPVDPEYLWAATVTRSILRGALPKSDVILTSGPPHSVHLVGKQIARRTGQVWVADFRDHFTLNPEYRPATPMHRWFDCRLETEVLAKADAIICNTRINRRELIRAFGVSNASRLYTVHNGFDLRDLKENNGDLDSKVAADAFSNDHLNVAYLGGLLGGDIDDAFFRVIDEVSRARCEVGQALRIHVFGDATRKTQLCDRMVQRGIVKLHPAVPANRLADVLVHADFCVAWRRHDERYNGTVPGKIYDYLAMKKPVFMLGMVGGETDRILRRYSLGYCVSPEDSSVACREMLTFIERWKNGGFAFADSRRYPLERFSRQSQAHQLASILDRVLESRP